jgi:uncharacterized protein DUF4282
MNGIVSRFLTFDKLIATGLIKVFYWIGIVGIALTTLIAFLGAFAAFGQSFAAGLGMLIMAPIGGIIAVIFWRFICEVYIVIFGMYDRLGNIQEAVGGGKAKDTAPPNA